VKSFVAIPVPSERGADVDPTPPRTPTSVNSNSEFSSRSGSFDANAVTIAALTAAIPVPKGPAGGSSSRSGSKVDPVAMAAATVAATVAVAGARAHTFVSPVGVCFSYDAGQVRARGVYVAGGCLCVIALCVRTCQCLSIRIAWFIPACDSCCFMHSVMYWWSNPMRTVYLYVFTTRTKNG
jgi:hypothetical protein